MKRLSFLCLVLLALLCVGSTAWAADSQVPDVAATFTFYDDMDEGGRKPINPGTTFKIGNNRTRPDMARVIIAAKLSASLESKKLSPDVVWVVRNVATGQAAASSRVSLGRFTETRFDVNIKEPGDYTIVLSLIDRDGEKPEDVPLSGNGIGKTLGTGKFTITR